MSKDYEPLHHKYRPQSFDDLVGQESIAQTLKQAITTNRIAPAYLFSGPRGTGKTSSARILARSLNCVASHQATTEPCGECDLCKTIRLGSALDVIEIDAASNTGVDNIRELIEKSQFAPVKARWKVYVIDECHMLSTAAFNALLKTLEEPPNQVVFILATTDPQRVLSTILSRCQRFDFRRINLEAISKHLKMIAKRENIVIDNSALEMIAKHAQGGLRDAESMLDQISLLPQPIQQGTVLELLGVIPENELLNLLEALTKSDPIATLAICKKLLELGKDPISILQGLASILRDLVIKIAAPEQHGLCNITQESQQKLEDISQNIKLEEVFRWQSELKGSENQLRQSLQPRLWLEVLFLGLLDKKNYQSTENINPLDIHEKKKPTVSSKEANSLTSSEENSKAQISNNPIKSDNIPSEKENQTTNSDLSAIWKTILASLELPSTRMLLSQQATLVELTEKKALINVSSNWISMIQNRKILIEEAITKSLGSHRELKINSQKELPKQTNDYIEPNKIKKEEVKKLDINKAQDKNSVSDANIKKDFQKENNKDIEDVNNESVKQFADFFNGEIVDLD
tara:strand:+ start:1338 stop:3065 length:1728 start_codon:yes stop_codon:yes gene_type:complete